MSFFSEMKTGVYMIFVKIAKVSEIPVGTTKHVEYGGKELCMQISAVSFT